MASVLPDRTWEEGNMAVGNMIPGPLSHPSLQADKMARTDLNPVPVIDVDLINTMRIFLAASPAIGLVLRVGNQPTSKHYAAYQIMPEILKKTLHCRSGSGGKSPTNFHALKAPGSSNQSQLLNESPRVHQGDEIVKIVGSHDSEKDATRLGRTEPHESASRNMSTFHVSDDSLTG
ncbi:hypothetical protein HPB49_024844 [Dermacentor silvarum]|uniref:Uncharacterized protein n=1 Tax=Dermacentor silvarum TaxID=543639 RepID=A0ACB8C620_DERSI|nr:hypothetical protein HPB49_024844 [Dermacentor silvarum]